jgi:hypothetical protein
MEPREETEGEREEAYNPTNALMIPMIRLQAMAIPLPVPRCAEGRTSGV